MKLNILLLVLFSLFSGCSCQNPQQLSLQEKENIKKELHDTVDKICRDFEKGDMDEALAPYLQTPEFKSVGFDGTIADFNKLKSDNEDVLKSFPTVKFTTLKEDYNFLANDLVLCLWSGKIEMTTEKGEKWKFDPETVTLIFRKTGDKWIAIFQHESALPPAKDTAEPTKM